MSTRLKEFELNISKPSLVNSNTSLDTPFSSSQWSAKISKILFKEVFTLLGLNTK